MKTKIILGVVVSLFFLVLTGCYKVSPPYKVKYHQSLYYKVKFSKDFTKVEFKPALYYRVKILPKD